MFITVCLPFVVLANSSTVQNSETVLPEEVSNAELIKYELTNFRNSVDVPIINLNKWSDIIVQNKATNIPRVYEQLDTETTNLENAVKSGREKVNSMKVKKDFTHFKDLVVSEIDLYGEVAQTLRDGINAFSAGKSDESIDLLKRHRELLEGQLFDVKTEIEELRIKYLEEYKNNPNSENSLTMAVLQSAVNMKKTSGPLLTPIVDGRKEAS